MCLPRARAVIVVFASLILWNEVALKSVCSPPRRLGVWLFVWGIILVNKWLAAFAILLCLFCLGCFALRNSD